MKGMNAENGKSLDGINHLKQSIKDILNTPIGSRVMRRDYGSELFKLIDSPLNASGTASIIAATAQAIKKWETRLDVKQIKIASGEPGYIELDITGVYKPNGQSITLEGIEVS
ncbi:GPW/gp25 family protein [Vibrio algicola]|uniref:Phage baseplate protein n=1 Tax=Vibrio algicola TaxID=2662262 RepID=A0A5Q0TM94_9VIBR|nr:GPW/gp25 family protein [Vibrio algicola]